MVEIILFLFDSCATATRNIAIANICRCSKNHLRYKYMRFFRLLCFEENEKEEEKQIKILSNGILRLKFEKKAADLFVFRYRAIAKQ